MAALQQSRELRVLIIDDSELVLETVGSALESAGFVVHTRNQAYGSAWEILKLRPDVVLVDVNMPGLAGDDVVAVARERAELENTRVLLFSSEPEHKLKELARRCKADGYLRKTSNHKALVENVRRWAQPAKRSGPKVLFVDPEQRMLSTYRKVFRTLSDIEFSRSGSEALEQIEKTPPSLVVCEVDLPGLSGEQLYERAVAMDPSWKSRFVFVTGAASRAWVARFLARVPQAVVHKPVSETRLAHEVTRRLK